MKLNSTFSATIIYLLTKGLCYCAFEIVSIDSTSFFIRKINYWI